MRSASLLVGALTTLVAVTAARPSAQCVTFSKTVSCARAAKPGVRADFRTTTNVLKPGSLAGTHQLPAPAGMPSGAIDCAMIQPVDPKFHSAMPIVRPNAGEGATFAMKIVQVPSCKSK